MPRMVPSQVVAVIKQVFPQPAHGRLRAIARDDMHAVMALLDLVDQIPQELMPIDMGEYSALVIGLNTLRSAVAQWPTRDVVIDRVPGHHQHVILLIRDTLAKCPDAAPTPATVALLFIPDPALRESLRLDISTAYQALANGEWKAATVLAGSVIEALLLWALQQYPEAAYQKALADVVAKKIVRQPRYTPVEQWDFVHYIAVAEELQRIKADTATLARLAKDFRNLIHPGAAQRLAQVCTRGTAQTALAAMQMVVEGLTP